MKKELIKYLINYNIQQYIPKPDKTKEINSYLLIIIKLIISINMFVKHTIFQRINNEQIKKMSHSCTLKM